MRTPLVVANWKMHGTIAQARPLAAAVLEGVRGVEDAGVVLCPPFTALAAVAEVLGAGPVGLGAQNCHPQASGAHTGEVAPGMLVELGCRHVIVGHSERRREMGETDDLVGRKVRGALAHGLVPILCVGETAEERRQGLTFTTVEGQLRAGLDGLVAESFGATVVAYEPVWAIGTGLNATPAQAGEVHGYLRGILAELLGKEIAQTVRILYGGSVKPDNAAALAEEPEIDGMLVGGASLDAAGFVTIVRKAAGADAAAEG